jgi:UDP:flavonoid glycosyltransferase YjiC (YdhE family)
MARRSNCLIHHGGYGSCQTGLQTGTPAVIIPTMSERESNARRIAAVGAGAFELPKHHKFATKTVNVEEVRTKIKNVLSDPSYRTNAERISHVLESYGGAEEASRLINKLIMN